MGRPQHESHQPPRPQSVGETRVSQGLAHLIMPPAGKHFPLATFEAARRSGELAEWRGKQTLPAVKKKDRAFARPFPHTMRTKRLLSYPLAAPATNIPSAMRRRRNAPASHTHDIWLLRDCIANTQ